MTMLTAAQRRILEDIASDRVTEWQESPDVFGDYQMLYEAGLIDGANATADDGFGLLDMRLTMAGQRALAAAGEEARPSWSRWTFWRTLIAGTASAIGLVFIVLTYFKTFGW